MYGLESSAKAMEDNRPDKITVPKFQRKRVVHEFVSNKNSISFCHEDREKE